MQANSWTAKKNNQERN